MCCTCSARKRIQPASGRERDPALEAGAQLCARARLAHGAARAHVVPNQGREQCEIRVGQGLRAILAPLRPGSRLKNRRTKTGSRRHGSTQSKLRSVRFGAGSAGADRMPQAFAPSALRARCVRHDSTGFLPTRPDGTALTWSAAVPRREVNTDGEQPDPTHPGPSRSVFVLAELARVCVLAGRDLRR